MSSKEIVTKTGLKVTQRSDAAAMGLRGAGFGSSADVRTKKMPCGKCTVAGRKSAPAIGNVGGGGKSVFPTAKGKGKGKSSPPKAPPPKPIRRSDALNTEFIYYNAAIKILAPCVSSVMDRNRLQPWLSKLYAPAYHADYLREKRNRFLLSLLVTMVNDEAFGIFQSAPPEGPLPGITETPIEELPKCAWERDSTWEDILNTLPSNLIDMGCSCCGGKCPNIEDNFNNALDDQFRFLLHLARPYVGLFSDKNQQDKMKAWLQILCCITPKSCLMMKGVRNDYIMALLGYANDLQLGGPFIENPPLDVPLVMLHIAAKSSNDSGVPTFLDPKCTETDNFLLTQPLPEEGAFCYIAITGEMLQSEDKIV